jgi:hypothetical protein
MKPLTGRHSYDEHPFRNVTPAMPSPMITAACDDRP